MLDIIKGPTTLTHVLFWLAVGLAVGDVIATLVTIIYQRYWYNKILRPKFAQTYTPRCAIIIPCKGNSKNLKVNLESFFGLDYPAYEVIFVTESTQDGATPVRSDVLQSRPNARYVAAGLSTSCAQKNHNLLAGVARAEGAEVLVFADSDVMPGKEWLREIVLPLANPDIVVTSGFRWLHATKGSVAELTHAYANIFIYVLFSCAFLLGGVGLWGGSMSIRRSDFEKLDVARKWATAVVDDMSLSQIVHKKRLKGIIVPVCIAHTDELFSSVKSGVKWFERQIMFLKVYFKHIWFFGGLPLAVSAITLIALLPLAIILSVSDSRTFFGSGGGAALAFYIGELATISLYPLLGSMPRFYRFLFFQPFLRITHLASYFSTLKTNTITWAGVKYRLKFFGDVTKVERPGDTR